MEDINEDDDKGCDQISFSRNESSKTMEEAEEFNMDISGPDAR